MRLSFTPSILRRVQFASETLEISQVPVIRTSADFKREVLQAAKPVLVDFSAEWCDGCQKLKPYLSEMASRYGDRIKVVEVELGGRRSPRDVDDYGRLYGVFGKADPATGAVADPGRGMPTLSLFIQGQEVKQFNFTTQHFQDLGVAVRQAERAILETALTWR